MPPRQHFKGAACLLALRRLDNHHLHALLVPKMRKYQYERIDLDQPSIRLARLLKGHHTDDIRCELFLGWLDVEEAIPYEALSYTWGDVSSTTSIIVNGYFALDVTTNLERALRYLRSPYCDRILWVDAICIDQQNLRERSHQVQRMGKIYRIADQVLIWLGEDADGSEGLMAYMAQLPDTVPQTQRIVGHPDQHDPFLGAVQAQGGASPVHSSALASLLRRPWFERAWILQEAANARRAKIVVGPSSVSAQKLVTAVALLGVSPDSHNKAVLDILPGASRKTSWWSHSRDLFTLLSRFRDSKAADRRDKIYALLDMSTDASDGRFPTVDYTDTFLAVVRKTSLFIDRSAPATIGQDGSPSELSEFDRLRARTTNSTLEREAWITLKIFEFIAEPEKASRYFNSMEGSIRWDDLDRRHPHKLDYPGLFPRSSRLRRRTALSIEIALQNIRLRDQPVYERVMRCLNICGITTSSDDRHASVMTNTLIDIFKRPPHVGDKMWWYAGDFNERIKKSGILNRSNTTMPKTMGSYYSRRRRMSEAPMVYLGAFEAVKSWIAMAASSTLPLLVHSLRTAKKTVQDPFAMEKLVTGCSLSSAVFPGSHSTSRIVAAWNKWLDFATFCTSTPNSIQRSVAGRYLAKGRVASCSSTYKKLRELHSACKGIAGLIPEHTQKIQRAIEKLPNGQGVVSSYTWTAASVRRWDESFHLFLAEMCAFEGLEPRPVTM